MATWQEESVLSEVMNVTLPAAKNSIMLLDQEYSVAFISRYRKDQTDGMSPETIRNFSEELQKLRKVKKKISSILKLELPLLKSEVSYLKSCTVLTDVEDLYAPYKPGSRKSALLIGRENGLDECSLSLIEGKKFSSRLPLLIKKDIKVLSSVEDVESVIVKIAADMLLKKKENLDYLHKLCSDSYGILLSSEQCTSAKKTAQSSGNANAKENSKIAEMRKFQIYFSFSKSVQSVLPHQILAINRGEKLKYLKVKILLSPSVSNLILKECNFAIRKPYPNSPEFKLYQALITEGQKSFTNFVIKTTRQYLNQKAEREALKIFSSNLKHRLLSPPMPGKKILGLDPGFVKGCKWATINESGSLLASGVIYLMKNKNMASHDLATIVKDSRVELIAIGNGCGARQTEDVVSKMIEDNLCKPFRPEYCIVSEGGASIYSASPLADKEFPLLDVSLRGAVSIARRLQDPLAELVKIDPKHLGIGMYQHDTKDSVMKTALTGVVQDTVSLVGVNVNDCSQILLEYISGIGATIAKNIVEHRETHGPFLCREALQCVKGVGEKTYKQIAGFTRISQNNFTLDAASDPKHEKSSNRGAGGGKRKSTSSSRIPAKKSKGNVYHTPNVLDSTSIHPESYDLAMKVMDMVQLMPQDVGTDKAKLQLQRFKENVSIAKLSAELDIGKHTLEDLIVALGQPLFYDIRMEMRGPALRTGKTSLKDLKLKDVLVGQISNVCSFGAFVDIGVECDGLIHSSKMKALKNNESLVVGNQVSVEVINLSMADQRVSLCLVEKL